MSQSAVSSSERVYREGTLDAYQIGVERAIRMMHWRLGEQITVDDLADAAFMSRFHFTRVFSKITGVSPARFLAAVRMQEAKRLLLQSNRSVTDISFDVGYRSLGTFTRIFSDFVGFSPMRFRQLSLALICFTIEDIIRFAPPSRARIQAPAIRGEVVCDRPLGLVAVALFPTAIPRSRPIECAYLINSRHFSFNCHPPCGARILAAGISPVASIEDVILGNEDQIRVGINVASRIAKVESNLELRQRRIVEPPVVVAFPLLIAESLMTRRMGTLGEARTGCFRNNRLHQGGFRDRSGSRVEYSVK